MDVRSKSPSSSPKKTEEKSIAKRKQEDEHNSDSEDLKSCKRTKHNEEDTEEDPFKSLVIASHDNVPKKRLKCPKCGKSKMYYCCDCCVPVGEMACPPFKLPINIDMCVS